MAPQTKNVPARNQKSDVRTARRITPRSAGRVGTIAPSVTPSGRRPTSAGSSRTHRRTGRTSTSASTPSTTAPSRQPAVTASAVSSGKKMSWPVLVLAPRIPVTRPRLRTNQRVATVGPRTLATRPGAEAGQQPEQQRQLPDLADQAGRDERRAGDDQAEQHDRPDPDPRAMSQPLSGPDRPKTTSPAAAANDTDAVDQPVPRSSTGGTRPAPSGRPPSPGRRSP